MYSWHTDVRFWFSNLFHNSKKIHSLDQTATRNFFDNFIEMDYNGTNLVQKIAKKLKSQGKWIFHNKGVEEKLNCCKGQKEDTKI